MRSAVYWILATVLVGGAAADFAGVEGFSGRIADCSSCHVPSDLAEAATVTVSGLPEAWTLGASYNLTITVSGGPPALPAPQPQGGFELEVSAGQLSIPATMDGLLRQASPSVMTYTPAGTQMRTWDATWTAPGLEVRPDVVGVWVAAVSANGNHIVATNASDLGELGDQVATWHGTIAPHPSAEAAWMALPLKAPTVSGTGTELTGTHLDRNATHLAWRFDNGAWQQRATGTIWRLTLDAAPTGILEIRSEGTSRTSPSLRIVFDDSAEATVLAPGEAAPDRNAPAPFLVLPALAAALVLTRRFS